jgi:hypothetical protein
MDPRQIQTTPLDLNAQSLSIPLHLPSPTWGLTVYL